MAPPASRRALSIARFFSRPPAPPASRVTGKRARDEGESAFAAVLRSPELVREAQALLDQILARGEPAEPPSAAQDAVWALVAVVATGIMRELKDERAAAADASAPWHLVQLLEEAGVGLLVFLQRFTSLFDRLLLDPELLGVTVLLKEEFTVASVLFEKYRVLWRKVAVDGDDGNDDEPEPERESSDENSLSNAQAAAASGPRRRRRKRVFDAGWLLFLLAKRRLSAHYTGLGPLYYLLLSVLLLVAPQARGRDAKPLLLHASPSVEAEVAAALSALGSHDVKDDGGRRTRRAAKRTISSVSSSSSTPASTTTGQAAAWTSAQILEALCAAPRVDPVEVTTALSHLTLVLKQLHEGGELVVASGFDPQGPQATSTLFGSGPGDAERRAQAIGDALFHADVLEKNVARLSAVYRHEYLDGCGKLDERLYLDARTFRVITDSDSKADDEQLGAGGNGTTANAVDASAARSPARSNATPARRQAAGNVANSSANAGHGQASASSATPTRGMMTPPPPRHQHPPVGFASPLRQSSGSWQWQASSSPAVAATGPGNVRAFLPFASSSNQQYYRPSPAAAGSQTPVTAAIETSHWVRDTLAPAVLRPVSPQLAAFFADCETDPRQRIAQILDDRAGLLLSTRSRQSPSPVPSMLTSISASLAARGLATDGSIRAASSGPSALQTGSFSLNASPATSTATYSGVDGSLKRTRDLSVALFYRVLESLVRAERARLQTADLSPLLNSQVFVSALFACCLEALLKTHALVTLSFPSLLDTVRVRAFDFGATIESFVKHGRLPPALKQHMRDIENRILDCLVWRSDSGLFGTAGAMDSAGASAAAGPKPSGLRLFFRMELSRAASRIYRLGTLLGLDTRSLNQVWTAVKECVCAHQHELMRDRHLDQMVLCCIYGVSKANRSDVTFKRINEAYKALHRQQQQQQQQQAPAPAFLSRTLDEVIRDIKLDDRGARGDIIQFYNRCFVPVMKAFLLQFQMQDKQLAAADAAGAAAAAGSASASPSSAPPGFTPRVPGAVPVATTVSDADIVAEAALEAVDRFLSAQSAKPAVGRASSANGTPPRSRAQAGARSSAPSSPSALFSSVAETQSLPVAVAMRNLSPHRVPASNVYMSPLQQVRLNRRSQTLTPRSHALYAFGESPARDLALINRAVNSAPAGVRRTEHASLMASMAAVDSGSDDTDEVASEPGTASRRQSEAEDESGESEEDDDASERSSSSTSQSVAIAALGSKRRRTR